jgi:hypothetical protein
MGQNSPNLVTLFVTHTLETGVEAEFALAQKPLLKLTFKSCRRNPSHADVDRNQGDQMSSLKTPPKCR